MKLGPMAQESLERLVDSASVNEVLAALEEICDAKAEHVESNWQDPQLAKLFRRAARVCGNAAAQVAV